MLKDAKSLVIEHAAMRFKGAATRSLDGLTAGGLRFAVFVQLIYAAVTHGVSLLPTEQAEVWPPEAPMPLQFPSATQQSVSMDFADPSLHRSG